MTIIMNLLTLLALILSPLILAANIPNSLSSSDMEGKTIGKMNFKGTLGGHRVQLNGSVQEIHAQMKNLHPDFDPDALNDSTNHTLAFRGAENKVQPPKCYPVAGQNWQRCDSATIKDGISYLQNFHGLCAVGARSCVRVSCSWKSAIWLCNDNYYGITPSCGYIASYAQDIINNCNYHDLHLNGGWFSCGQEFDTDNYNVIVRYDPSNGC